MTVTAKKSQAKTATANSETTAIDLQERIRRRAYELYERRGRECGHEVEDWLQAEAELAAEQSRPAAVAAVKAARKAPVPRTGKAKAKPVKKSRPSAQIRSEAE